MTPDPFSTQMLAPDVCHCNTDQSKTYRSLLRLARLTRYHQTPRIPRIARRDRGAGEGFRKAHHPAALFSACLFRRYVQ